MQKREQMKAPVCDFVVTLVDWRYEWIEKVWQKNHYNSQHKHEPDHFFVTELFRSHSSIEALFSVAKQIVCAQNDKRYSN